MYGKIITKHSNSVCANYNNMTKCCTVKTKLESEVYYNKVCSFVTPVSVISLLHSSTERWWNKVIRVEACFYIIKPAYQVR